MIMMLKLVNFVIVFCHGSMFQFQALFRSPCVGDPPGIDDQMDKKWGINRHPINFFYMKQLVGNLSGMQLKNDV